VTREDDVERWVAETESAFGPIDLLVNNAGLGGRARSIVDEDPAEWWRVFEVNVLGPFLTSRAALPGMLARGSGRIVKVGSGAAYLPLHGPGRLRTMSSRSAPASSGRR
jgi:NAD(P)-dependent dehydrogenase (short-subunit alcohol dehydrogenase family)